MEMTKLKQIAKKGIIIFLGTLLVTFLVLFVLIDPMVQDAYNKGYKKGINETCNPEWFYKNTIAENWDVDSPFGRTGVNLNLSLNFS